MSDETRAVPTSADIEAIRQRAEAATAGPWYKPPRAKWADPPNTEPDPNLIVSDRANICMLNSAGTRDNEYNANGDFIAHARTDVPALLAALDGERRHRADLERRLAGCHRKQAKVFTSLEDALDRVADLERQLEEARELLGYVALRFRQSLARTPIKDATECLASAAAFLARQVIQEAETPC